MLLASPGCEQGPGGSAEPCVCAAIVLQSASGGKQQGLGKNAIKQQFVHLAG